MSRELALGLILALLVLAPAATAHGSNNDGHVAVVSSDEPVLAPPTQGYTGPGPVPYLSFFQGTWLYGQSSSSPLGHQLPRAIVGSGDWLAWEDAAQGRVFAYNIPAGAGYYVGNASSIQRSPALSGSILVWEDYRARQSAQVWSFDLSTGDLRQLSHGVGNHRHPSIDGTLVAWEADNGTHTDIWGYDFANATEFPIYQSGDKDQDPLVVGQMVYFRAFRFNVWDIRAVDLAPEGNGTIEVTSDAKIQAAPFSNGREAYFLTQYIDVTWTLARYDARLGRVVETNLHMQDASPTPMSEDRILELARDVGYAQLVVRNVTQGSTAHVSGNLAISGTPLLMGRTIYAAVRTTNGTSLLTLDVSPFAFGKPASLAITSPGAVYPWVRPVSVQGVLNTGPGWSEPVTFTYQVDDNAPVSIPPSQAWRVTLDNQGQATGNHAIVFRATFREGPPVRASLTLAVPSASSTVDVAQAGNQFHSARVLGALNEFVLTNPAAYLLVVLAIALVVLVLVRVWLYYRRNRAEYIIEYVPPPDE